MRTAQMTILAIAACALPALAESRPPAPPMPTDVAAVEPLTPEQVDALVEAGIEDFAGFETISDEQFLRRATLDLLGRQPSIEEFRAFKEDERSDKRSRAIDRLIESSDFGENWANYWSDTISYRVQPPQLTFLEYEPFKAWLADELNKNTPWDEVVRKILTGTGKVAEHPEATFVAYHQGHPTRLATETARVFLSVQIECAECHDHPADVWTREEFHHMAAFFARTKVDMPWNKGAQTIVKDKGKGEYRMPNAANPNAKGKMMEPAFLEQDPIPGVAKDLERRKQLAMFVTSSNNKWFAKAYTNRIWARLMGRGFYEPVDNIGDFAYQLLPEVHKALSTEFVRSGFDTKELFRLLMKTDVYQQKLAGDEELTSKPFASAKTGKLRGDEVFDSLVTAIGLPNLKGKQAKATKAVRFPPPPKSTRDLVAEAFGFDPSRESRDVMRTMNQAMLMMNNKQLQAQIDADPASNTALSRLLAKVSDDRDLATLMFQMVLARTPTDKELDIAMKHVESIEDRGAAFEDLLWSLINSTEFTTRR